VYKIDLYKPIRERMVKLFFADEPDEADNADKIVLYKNPSAKSLISAIDTRPYTPIIQNSWPPRA
jgi:hypothetical protein